jgi:hypothetical protein
MIDKFKDYINSKLITMCESERFKKSDIFYKNFQNFLNTTHSRLISGDANFPVTLGDFLQSVVLLIAY